MKITKAKIDKIRKDVSAALKAANRSDEIETRGCATAEFQTYELDTGEEWDAVRVTLDLGTEERTFDAWTVREESVIDIVKARVDQWLLDVALADPATPVDPE